MDSWQTLKAAIKMGWRNERPTEPLKDTVAAAEQFIASKRTERLEREAFPDRFP